MALRNGLLVHGPTHWAAAVRTRSGSIAVASGRKARLRGFDRVPGVRGLARLSEAAAVVPLVKRALPQAQLPFQSPGVLGVGAAVAVAGTRLRDRCGSHLLAPMLAANLAGTALLRSVVTERPPWAAGAVSLASVGVAVEVFAWSERHASSATARALRRPGHELQRAVGTREPTAAQLDVGRAALAEILRVEGAPGATAAP
jgi:uncharacterized protein YqhQ